MRFGGLFDCAKPKIHGLGLIIYDNVINELDAAFMDIETNYEDFVNIQGSTVNPLNYAPPSLVMQERLPRVDKLRNPIPISRLHHLPSPKYNDCKFTITSLHVLKLLLSLK